MYTSESRFLQISYISFDHDLVLQASSAVKKEQFYGQTFLIFNSWEIFEGECQKFFSEKLKNFKNQEIENSETLERIIVSYWTEATLKFGGDRIETHGRF